MPDKLGNGPYEAMRWLEEKHDPVLSLGEFRTPEGGRTMLEELIISGFGGQGVHGNGPTSVIRGAV